MANGTEIDIRSGTEGPAYDPYHWDEITVKTKGREVCFHLGLAVWMTIDGLDVLNDEEDLFPIFKELTGMSVTQAFKYFYRYRSRCQKCGSRSFEWRNGYPGEQMKMCTECDHIVDYTFNESAII